MRKRSSEEAISFSLSTSSPSCSDRAPSASSDSGLSVASQGLTGARQRRGATPDKSTQERKFIPGVDFDPARPLLEVMTELVSSGGGLGEMAGGLNGEASSSERETDILDDEDEAGPVANMPSSSSSCSLSSENLPETQRSAQMEYSTQSWVHQQQMVEVVGDGLLVGEVEGRSARANKQRPPPLVAPDTPLRGLSSREVVQRAHLHDMKSARTTSPCQEDELASLSTDIDESIEQLNQLILDLDPTFVPVPTSCGPLSRSASLHTNGISHKGGTHLTGKLTQNA